MAYDQAQYVCLFVLQRPVAVYSHLLSVARQEVYRRAGSGRLIPAQPAAQYSQCVYTAVDAALTTLPDRNLDVLVVLWTRGDV